MPRRCESEISKPGLPMKCDYSLTLISRISGSTITGAPDYQNRCSLTGRMCYCTEDSLQCARRTYVLEYERYHKIGPTRPEIKPQTT